MIIMIVLLLYYLGDLDMRLIQQQYMQTEEELSRQQLKIKLNAKPLMHHQIDRRTSTK